MKKLVPFLFVLIACSPTLSRPGPGVSDVAHAIGYAGECIAAAICTAAVLRMLFNK